MAKFLVVVGMGFSPDIKMESRFSFCLLLCWTQLLYIPKRNSIPLLQKTWHRGLETYGKFKRPMIYENEIKENPENRFVNN